MFNRIDELTSNLLINSSGRINQRTSGGSSYPVTLTTSYDYYCDRWITRKTGSSSGLTVTYSPRSTYEGNYFHRFSFTWTGGVAGISHRQYIEGGRFKNRIGQKVSLSFKCRFSAPDITSRMVVGLINPTAEDDYTTTVDVVREDNLDMSSVVTPNVWYEYKIENIEVTEAFANGLGLDLWAGTLDSVTDDGGTVDFKDLMINFGEKALPWTELLEEFEWIMCRRYTTYMKVFAATSGYALGGGYYHFMQPIPSYMRATPTISGITVATFLTVAATGGNRALVQSTTAATTAGYQNALLDAEIY